MKTIKNWKIVTINGDQCVTGLVYNHPAFKDGSDITTSPTRYRSLLSVYQTI
jgi:hypothetical protein